MFSAVKTGISRQTLNLTQLQISLVCEFAFRARGSLTLTVRAWSWYLGGNSSEAVSLRLSSLPACLGICLSLRVHKRRTFKCTRSHIIGKLKYKISSVCKNCLLPLFSHLLPPWFHLHTVARVCLPQGDGANLSLDYSVFSLIYTVVCNLY